MKIELIVTIELQVTEKANEVSSNEKVVWARLIGSISAPFLPREKETVWVHLFSDTTTDPLTVLYTKYILNAKNVLEPEVHCAYSLPSDPDEEGTLEARIAQETEMLNDTIIPRLRRNGFKVDHKTVYGHKTPPSI